MPLLRVALSMMLFMGAISMASPLVAFLSELIKNDALASYAGLLLKALGIAVMTQCCAELCRECGESAAANGMELIGKIELLLLSLPLVNEILSGAESLLSLGG